jgi:flagellar FliL protein
MANAKDAKTSDDKSKDADAKTEARDGEVGDATEKPKGRFAFLKLNLSRKTLMFVVAPAALVLTLGLGAYFFLFSGSEEAAVADAAHGGEHGEGGGAGNGEGSHPVFVEVPDILVNIAVTDSKPGFLKLSVSLELEGGGEEAKAAIEPVMPRIVDQLQTYLRELRVEDLTGSAAVFRLKEEILRRINLAVEPMRVKDVLFREMIIQ